MSEYYPDKKTEDELDELEKTLKYVYEDAYSELSKKVDEYFKSFEKRDIEMLEKLKKGDITKEYYKQWRFNQIGRGDRWKTMKAQMENRIVEANKVAAAYVNDTTPGIYSLNHNYSLYEIGNVPGVSFTLVDEATIKELVTGGNHVDFKVLNVNEPKDYQWNSQLIQAKLTSGILQGKSTYAIANSFMGVMQSNYAASVRNARTAITSAQNGGRFASYEQMARMGIDVQKEWMATSDERTRESHLEIDGEVVPYNDPFSNGLMYPGDSGGEPSEVYNCRCTMRSVFPKSPYTPNKSSFKQWSENQRIEKGLGTDSSYQKGDSVAKKVGKVDYSDKTAIQNELNKSKEKYSTLDYEMNTTITKNGEIWEVKGMASQVDPRAIPYYLDGSYSYHNHPSSKTKYSFSADDVEFFISTKQQYSEASDDKYEYVMERTSKTLSDPSNIRKRFDEIWKSDILELSMNGKIDIDVDEYHEIIKRLSKEYGFKYNREKKE